MNRLLRSPRLSIADRFADAGLWLMAVLNLLAAICFILTLLSLSPAHAADDACGGRNLIADMRASDPVRFAALERQAAAVPNGKGIFWKIEKAGARALLPARHHACHRSARSRHADGSGRRL